MRRPPLQNGDRLTRAEFERRQVSPGLILSVTALLAGDLAQVLGAVQQGVQTPEHRAFVQQLSDLAA